MTDMTADEYIKKLRYCIFSICGWFEDAAEKAGWHRENANCAWKSYDAAMKMKDAEYQALTAPRVPDGRDIKAWLNVSADGTVGCITDELKKALLARGGPVAASTRSRYRTPLFAAAPAPAEPVVCKHCGNPTMHIGDVCYACCQSPAEQTTDVNGMLVTHDREGRVSKIVQSGVPAQFGSLALRKENVSAMREASSLAISIWRQHYKDVSPNFELCDSVAGVITQIDNMAAGLSEKIVERDAELANLRERVRELEEALNDLLNDCINFDGGKLTDRILEQSAARLRGGSDE